MRTIKFRDVLWGAAYRIGLDPAKEFLQDQADALASYINGWIRRLYDSQDWPEWTKIKGFEVDPATNLVPYTLHLDSRTSGGSIETLGRIFDVFLLDPLSTRKPFKTRFRLTPDGIWPGYDHGGSVWIKYIPQCPQVTCTPWRSDLAYSKDALVYSPTIGECYRSKSSNNLGHDPTYSFTPNPPQDDPTLPPIPPADQPPKPPIVTEVIQERTPSDPGLVGQSQILEINFDQFQQSQPVPDPFHIPDPPALNDSFFVDIWDQDDNPLGDSGVIAANGVDSLASIMTALAAALDTDLGGTFAVTATATTVVVEDASIFKTRLSFYRPSLGYPYYYPTQKVNQSYVPATAGVAGDPQKTLLTLTEGQVSTGSTYGITLRGPDGLEHVIGYTSQEGDSAKQILVGLLMAAESARTGDPYFDSVDVSLSTTDLTLVISTRDVASINADIGAPNSPWWELQPIPFELADALIRGEMADTYREEGQTDRADGEEKKVETEVGVATSKFTTPDFLPLTDQQKPKSRYSIK